MGRREYKVVIDAVELLETNLYSLYPKISDSHSFLGRSKISGSFPFLTFSLLLFFLSTLLTLLLYSLSTLLIKSHFLKSCAEKFWLTYLGTEGVIVLLEIELARELLYYLRLTRLNIARDYPRFILFGVKDQDS